MEETEAGAAAGVASRVTFPVRPRRLEQLEGADDVGVHEVAGALDRTVDVALGGEVDHRVDGVLGEHPAHQLAVGDVAVNELVARLPLEIGEAFAVPRVGEFVEHDHAEVRLREQQAHEVAADEPGAAGDQDAVHGGA